MNTNIIVYSRTGRNEALADKIAKKLPAGIITVTEPKNRTYLTITLDLLLNRNPAVNFSREKIETGSFIIFISPVWFGRIAFPIRTCIEHIKPNIKKYAFISLSSGGSGPDSNPGLSGELTDMIGKKPVTIINFHVADLIPNNSKPTPREIDNYIVTEKEINELADKAVGNLREYIEE